MRKWKTALSLSLALVLSLPMTVPAFAADGTTVTSAPGEPINITFDSYLRTEYIDSGDEDSFYAVCVVKDGSTVYVDSNEYTFQYGLMENVYGYSPETGLLWVDTGPLSLGGDMSRKTVTVDPAQTVDDMLFRMFYIPGFGKDSYCWMCESDFAKIAPKHKGVPGPDSTIIGTVGPAAKDQPTQPTTPEQSDGVKTANPSGDKLSVNGVEGSPTVYNINNNNYFKIRDVAALLSGTEKQFSVGYDGEKQSVTATTGQSYDKLATDLAGKASAAGEAKVSSDTIYVNGQKIEAEVYNINGNNYFKLRDLGKALNFYVGWTLEQGVCIETNKPYSE